MEEEQALILIVDDNEMNRDILARRLKRQGYETVMAENGVVALEMVRQHPFDLMLLDIMMPEMNGFQVLEHLKANAEWRDIPVIVISAADDMDSIVRCVELGAEDYLPKPYNTLLLKARIGASLEKKRLRDAEKAHLVEMAVMQGIDRELSATLDVKRAMEITLGWALRHSGDEVGFMGEVEDGRIHVLISKGYAYELTADSSMLIPDELPAVQQALESRKAAFRSQTTGTGLLARAQSQIAVPVCRGNDVLAMIVMENSVPKQWSAQVLTFLNRLGDHAAMAIANAQLYTAVQAADLAKTEFVSFVSHELKIPMTSIKGYADLLLTGSFGAVNEMQTKFLGTIRANVDRMARLVSDLTDISRIESGHLLLEMNPVSLAEVVEDVVQSTRAQIEAKMQTLTLEVADDLPLVYGDRTRLIQVVTNLVSNAYKYTPEQGHIAIRAKVVMVADEEGERQMVQMAVADTGLGIPEEAQPTIFEKFTRVDDEEARKSPGTGLGLSITKSLVELHNGRIWFVSQYRQGTTFYFTVPVA
ncbi:MAG: response regulator [Ardenticatenaceae bacterium]|nr:response regulator [Ardenticatenaceae bacterium]